MNIRSPVDFHCHLDLMPDVYAAYERCDAIGCTTLSVTTTPGVYLQNLECATSTQHVHAALGLHPQLVAEYGHEIELFEHLALRARFIGEIGLDAGKCHYPSFDRQKQFFDRALYVCAREGGKVLSVHSVRCARHVLDAIEKHSVAKSCDVVLHWFSAGKTELDRAINLGCYFSINQKLIDSTNGKLLVNRAPINRLLTETDAPFLKIDGHPVGAGDVSAVVSHMSTLLDIPFHDLCASIADNARRLVNGD